MKYSAIFNLLIFGLIGSLQITQADPITYTYTPISVPGSSYTIGSRINNAGQIVGTYAAGTSTHGFLYSNGTYTTIDVPGQTSTTLLGLNNVGQIVGAYLDSGGTQRLFLDNNGVFTTINVPGGLDGFGLSLGAGINDAGQIVSTADGGRAFRYDNGQFFYIPRVYGPVSGANFAADINNAGQIAMAEAGPNTDTHAYVYANGVSTSIRTPTSTSYARGINNAGDVAGTYQSFSSSGSFLYSGGVVTTFDDSSSPNLFDISGINDAGQLIGRGREGTVLATPNVAATPEPASLLLMTSGLAGVGLLVRRKRKNIVNY